MSNGIETRKARHYKYNMTDDTTEKPTLNSTWKITIALIVLAFNACTLWWLLLYGHSENLLHQNALSWQYMISGGVLAGIGFGEIVQFLPAILNAKK